MAGVVKASINCLSIFDRYAFFQMLDYSTLHSINSRKERESVWTYVQVVQNRYVALHHSVTRLSTSTILQFLIDEWRSELILNDSTAYRAYEAAGFYFYTVESFNSTRPACDSYGKWKHNGVKKTTTLEIYYRYHKHNSEFKKVEYRLLEPIDGIFRGIVLYYRPVNCSVEPQSSSPHKNAKHGVSYQRMSNESIESVRHYVAAKRNPTALFKEIERNRHTTDVVKPRNPKQIDNIQQQHRDPQHEIDQLIRFSSVHKDTQRYLAFHPSEQAVLFTDDAIVAMKRHHVWYSDITFNCWKGFVTGVQIENQDLQRGKLQVGYIYLHQVSFVIQYI